MSKKFEDPKANICLTPDQIAQLRKEGKLPPAPPENPRSQKTMRETPESKLKTRLLPFLVKQLEFEKGSVQAADALLTSMRKPKSERRHMKGLVYKEYTIDDIKKQEDFLLGHKLRYMSLIEAYDNLNSGHPLPADLILTLKAIEKDKAANLRQATSQSESQGSNQILLAEAQAELTVVAELINALEKK
ncbi:MAG: hypothetical protein PHC70_00570 [Patescibacteria group bacterium]|nr:hypothetical protein [Patescibacteria group bacterium]